MKIYSMSFAAALEHKPDHPERTARREGTGMNFDITFQVWPNRASMLKTIEIQDRAGNGPGKWRPCVKRTY
jgi:hypothetical protein